MPAATSLSTLQRLGLASRADCQTRRAARPRLLLRARLLLPLVVALIGLSLPAAPAQAGQYNVYLCKTPSGKVVPLGLTRDWNGPDVTVEDDCGGRGGVVAFWTTARNPPNYARATVTAPSGIGIAQANVKRAVSIQPGADGNAVPEWALYRDAAAYDDYHLIERCSPGCYSIDWPSGSTITANFPAADQAKAIVWEVRCGGTPIGTCGAAASGERIVATVYQLHLVLEESSPPDVVSLSGPATQVSTTKTGVVNAQISATDTGAGVYQAYARLDNIEVGRVTVGGGCSDQGNTAGSDLDFTAMVPCPGSVSGLNLPINTATPGVGNGSRRLRINLRDAAGNDTLIFSDFVNVSNGTPSPTPTPTPTPTPVVPTPTPTPGASPTPTPTPSPLASGPLVENGVPRPAAEGKLTLRAPARSIGARVPGAVTGQLVTPAGQPLASATIGVELRLRVAGAPWVRAASVTTDAKGAFTIPIPAGASREVRASYAHAGGTATAQAAVKVRAPLSISPESQRVARFGRLRLAGQLTVEGFPKRGAYVDLQLRDRSGWRTITAVRTDQSGRWTWSYRLASGQRATYRFRARLRPAADVASAVTTSRTVTVRVR